MGNDEHSQNVFRARQRLGLEPLAYCDQMERVFRDVWARLDISYDDFIRTTEPRHRPAVQELIAAGCRPRRHLRGVLRGLVLRVVRGLQAGEGPGRRPVPAAPDRRPSGSRRRTTSSGCRSTSSRCSSTSTRTRSSSSRTSGATRSCGCVEGGLEDISISRAGQLWGIPLPFDSGSVVYVWFDALINYISAVGYGTDEALFRRWWPADLHVIGKDITRFHCVIWPAMLMSAGLPLPQAGVRPRLGALQGPEDEQVARHQRRPAGRGGRFGPDPLRLYLVKEIAVRAATAISRGSGSRSATTSTWRTTSATSSAACPPWSNVPRRRAGAGDGDGPDRWRRSPTGPWRRTAPRWSGSRCTKAPPPSIGSWTPPTSTSPATEPWTLATRPGLAAGSTQVLYEAAEAVRIAARAARCRSMPGSAAEILRRDGRAARSRGPGAARRRGVDDRPGAPHRRRAPRCGRAWKTATGRDRPRPRSPPAVHHDDGDQPMSELEEPGPAPRRAGAGRRARVDRRLHEDRAAVAKVLAAEPVPKSKKLLKLQVDLGTEQRTLVAGIAEAYGRKRSSDGRWSSWPI